MVTFVGAEYIIANSLIALKKRRNRSNISLSELHDLGIFIQKMSVKEDVDAVFLVSQDQMTSALYDFSDYFGYDEVNKTVFVKQTKQITDLASRFVGYLPWEVLSFLVQATNAFVQQVS